MMLQQSGWPVVQVVTAGYALMALSLLAGIAVLAWDSRAFLGNPATPRDRLHREYVESLLGGVWKLASGVVVAMTAGISFVALAWSMS